MSTVPSDATYSDVMAAADAMQLAAVTPVHAAYVALTSAIADARTALTGDTSSRAAQLLKTGADNTAAIKPQFDQLVTALTPPAS